MSALAYLMRTRTINQIKALFRKPGQLVGVIILVLLLAFTFLNGRSLDSQGPEAELPVLYAGLTVLYAGMYLVLSYKGLSKGATLYTMADVNLLFPSPLSPKRVLFYGLVRQLGMALFMGFFLLFQYSWLHQLFGVGIPFLILLIGGYALTILGGQVTSMLLYTLTGNHTARRVWAKVILFGLALLGAGYVGYQAMSAANPFEAAVEAVNSTVIQCFPVGGWLSAAASGIYEGNVLPVVLGLGGFAAFCGLAAWLISILNTDFYEDVLQATEISFSAVTASKEGKINDPLPKNIKLGKTGLGKGAGADTFFYRLRLENRRASVFVFDTMTCIFIVVLWGVGFIYLKTMEGPDDALLTLFFTGLYMQLFTVGLGRWVRELLLPYIYLVPESPFQKLMACVKESIPRSVLEAAVIFLPLGLLMRLNLMTILFCILARACFALLFTSGNIMIERLFSGITIKWLATVLYFIIIFVLSGSCVAAGLGLGYGVFALFLPEMMGAFAGLCVASLAVGVLVIFLCRNMLTYAELNNQ